MRRFIICTLQQIDNQMKEDEKGGECSMHGEMRNGYAILVRRSNVRSHLGDFGICEDGIEMNHREVLCMYGCGVGVCVSTGFDCHRGRSCVRLL
jgi:hypothetical protein